VLADGLPEDISLPISNAEELREGWKKTGAGKL
jgi:hypothetical protein